MEISILEFHEANVNAPTHSISLLTIDIYYDFGCHFRMIMLE